MPKPAARRLFTRGDRRETSRVADLLRAETTGGLLLIVGAFVAMVWANSAWSDVYVDLREWRVGPGSLHLHLSLGAWAADGLLAVFFLLAGLEVKREFVAGDLRDPGRAVLPVVAAAAGMVVPAALFCLVNGVEADGDLNGWAVPTATDIAFAVAILAVISTHLPSGLRTFLLTLAVVDDLLAITVIALFYTDELEFASLGLAVLPLAAFAILVRRGPMRWWLLTPLAVATWALVHASGVHATVAGVLLAFTVPVTADGPTSAGPAERLEHLLRPFSAGVAVPVFAFFAAGVALGGLSGLVDALGDPVALGVVVGLVLGKPIGITAATWLLARFTRAELDEDLAWIDVVGMAMLAGIGFTVSLLIGELAYTDDATRVAHVKVGVLVASLLAAVSAGAVLRSRNRHYRRRVGMVGPDDAPSTPSM